MNSKEKSKKRKSSQQAELQEIRPVIDKGDIATKLKHAIKF